MAEFLTWSPTTSDLKTLLALVLVYFPFLLFLICRTRQLSPIPLIILMRRRLGIAPRINFISGFCNRFAVRRRPTSLYGVSRFGILSIPPLFPLNRFLLIISGFSILIPKRRSLLTLSTLFLRFGRIFVFAIKFFIAFATRRWRPRFAF